MAPLTAEEMEERRKYIGASDVPIILGLSKYKTAEELYREKSSEIPAVASEDSEASYWGQTLEPILFQEWVKRMGYPPEAGKRPIARIHHSSIRWACCTPDGWINMFGVEIKNRAYGTGWGPSSSEEIPLDVEAQVRWSMFVMDTPYWGVGVLLGGNEFRTYLIHRDRAWEEWAFPIVEAFRDGVFLKAGFEIPIRSATVKASPTAAYHLHTYAVNKRSIAMLEEDNRNHLESIKEELGNAKALESNDYRATQTFVKGRTQLLAMELAYRMKLRYSELALKLGKTNKDIEDVYNQMVEASTTTGKPYRRIAVKAISRIAETPPAVSTSEEEQNDV